MSATPGPNGSLSTMGDPKATKRLGGDDGVLNRD